MIKEQQLAKTIKADLDFRIISTGGQIKSVYYKVYHPDLKDCDITALFKYAEELGYNFNYACDSPYYRLFKKDNFTTIIAYYK